METFISERILKTEEQLFSEADRILLSGKRNKQLIYLFSSYIPLALILLYVFIDGLSVVYRDKYPYPTYEITDEDIANFNLVAPYTCGFFFVALTIFFIVYYSQTVAPLIKDIQKNKKLLLFIKLEKTEMAFFNKYFISTPIRKKQQIQISKEDFYSITENTPLIIEVTPFSQIILSLKNLEKEINFF